MHRTARTLSFTIAALMALASASGLLLDGLYRDNLLVSSGWRGNDLVSLLVATPLLVASLVKEVRGSLRARLAWLGMLDYTLYNYAFYLFGAAFNALFLVYVLLFTFSMFALIFALSGLAISSIGARIEHGAAVRWVSGFLGVLAAALGGFHGAVAAGYWFTGQVPAIVTAVGHPTHLIAALDLSLVVSVSALAAVWLWRGRPWGYVVAAMTLVKGSVYMLALSAATVAALRAGASSDVSPLALWAVVGIGCLVGALTLLGRLREDQRA